MATLGLRYTQPECIKLRGTFIKWTCSKKVAWHVGTVIFKKALSAVCLQVVCLTYFKRKENSLKWSKRYMIEKFVNA